mgnify:CR=1 FL=1
MEPVRIYADLFPMKRSVAKKMTDVRNTNSPAVAGGARRRIHDVGLGSIHRSDVSNIPQLFAPSNLYAECCVDR